MRRCRLRSITSVSASSAQQCPSARGLQQCARFGQVDAFADAIEQRDADAGLECLDALGDRRLSEVQLLGRARKRALSATAMKARSSFHSMIEVMKIMNLSYPSSDPTMAAL